MEQRNSSARACPSAQNLRREGLTKIAIIFEERKNSTICLLSPSVDESSSKEESVKSVESSEEGTEKIATAKSKITEEVPLSGKEITFETKDANGL